MTVTNAPVGQFSWNSGNGNDSLTLAPTTAGQSWNVKIKFGDGDDTFTLGGTGAGQSITGRVDGGGHVTANVFTQGSNWTPGSPFRVVNFP
jgi:hypothetical protein